MTKRLLTLAFSAAFSMAAANAHADTILIGGTSLTLVYSEALQSICDSSGCDSFADTADLTDAATLSSLDFEVNGGFVGGLDAVSGDLIYVDVNITSVDLTPGALSADFLFGGTIDFYTQTASGFDFLQLTVTGGAIVYVGDTLGLLINTTNSLVDQDLTYSFGTFFFTDPGISWAFSSAASTSVANTSITATGTPDWFDNSVRFDRPVPEPASMLLLGTGLLGSAGLARLRRRRSK